MRDESGSIQLNRAQIQYLMKKTGAKSPDEAVEVFATLMVAEHVSPREMATYINKMMEKEASK